MNTHEHEAILRVLSAAHDQGKGGLEGAEVYRAVTGNIDKAGESRYRRILKALAKQGKVVNDTKQPHARGQWRIVK
ncbi:MAG: hypothetical protein F4Y49_03610 [Dehalococcoidia bacterium]|nr:hypothetical protein [Dehalococcoidia bacterium]